MRVRNNYFCFFFIVLMVVFSVQSLAGHAVEFSTPYYCNITDRCLPMPSGAGTSCFKKKNCNHAFIIANNSTVRWLYSFIDDQLFTDSNPIISYEILPPLSFAEYNWQKTTESYKVLSEWDPEFRQKNPMPDDPANPQINDQYIILALTQQALKKAIKEIISSKKWDRLEHVIVIKAISTTGAKDRAAATSSIIITGKKPHKQSIAVISGLDAIKKAEIEILSKIAPQNRSLD